MKIFLSIIMILIFGSEKVTIKGVITDDLTGNPIESVSVVIKQLKLKTTTDYRGQFVFKEIPKGQYRISFIHPDFIKQEKLLNANQKENVIQIKLKPSHTRSETELTSELAEDLEIVDIAETAVPILGNRGKTSQKLSSAGSLARSRIAGANHYFPHQSPNQQNTEEYAYQEENRFFSAIDRPLSTFSIDVDGASYSNVRRFLKNSKLPPKDAVRVEEFINYFQYDYQYPSNEIFSTQLEIAECPWNPNNKLVQIGIQSQKPDRMEMPNSHLVFLLDVSGSMNSPNKLPLLKKSLNLLLNQLGENDRVSIVVYAGAAGKILEAVSAHDKQRIMSAINRLQAGGSTAGGQGIQLAYKLAKKHFIKNGNNRIILATDGDFNVGISNNNQLQRLIEEKRKSGVFLSVMGFGMGNYKDAKMEILANKGNGNYAYIDNLLEAKKVFVNEIGATLHTIAKDVKLQIEFNPNRVKSYRLIGYENRLLNKEDFNDDLKDAGELGAGHSVTALYEIVPADEDYRAEIPLKYQQVSLKEQSTDWLTVKIRYKKPNEDKSELISFVLNQEANSINESSNSLQFSAAVAQFAMLLKDSKYKENASFRNVIELARRSKGSDKFGYRAEFIQLVELAELLTKNDT